MLSLRCQSYSTYTQKNETELDHDINTNLELEVDTQCKKYIFQSKDEMSRSLSKLCYGNLYVIGSIWIEGMTKVMLGKRMCVVPKINAATTATNNNNEVTEIDEAVIPHKPNEEEYCIPKKPPDMRYSELPLCCSPHRDYNEYQHYAWCQRKSQIFQTIIYPFVRQARISIQNKAKESRRNLSENLSVLRYMIAATTNEIQDHLRNPCNRVKAKACVAMSTATGVVLGSKKGLLRAIFYGGLGAMASGMLCFPKEMDIILTNVYQETWSMITQASNTVTGKNKTYPCPKIVPKCPEEDGYYDPNNANNK